MPLRIRLTNLTSEPLEIEDGARAPASLAMDQTAVSRRTPGCRYDEARDVRDRHHLRAGETARDARPQKGAGDRREHPPGRPAKPDPAPAANDRKEGAPLSCWRCRAGAWTSLFAEHVMRGRSWDLASRSFFRAFAGDEPAPDLEARLVHSLPNCDPTPSSAR